MEEIKSGFRLEGIESLRAFAASMVVMVHIIVLGNVFLPDEFSLIPRYFGLGVQLFFVVSGFGLAHGYYGRLYNNSKLGEYYIRRIARIIPLFYFMIGIYAISAARGVGRSFSLQELALNLLCIFNFIPSKFQGIVSASWTIGIEMMFYLIFPVVIFMCRNILTTIFVFAVSIFLACCFAAEMVSILPAIPAYSDGSLVSNMPFFVCGIGGYHAFKWMLARVRSDARNKMAYLVIAFACIFAVINCSEFLAARLPSRVPLYLWGIVFAALCVAVAIHPVRVISNFVTRYVGKVSFSVYLLHPIILYRMGALGIYHRIYLLVGNDLLGFCLSWLASMIVVVAVSSMTFRFIEKPGIDIGKRVGKFWSARVAVPAIDRG